MATRRSTRISLKSESTDAEMDDSPRKKSPTKKVKDSRPPHIDPPEYEVVGEAFVHNVGCSDS